MAQKKPGIALGAKTGLVRAAFQRLHPAAVITVPNEDPMSRTIYHPAAARHEAAFVTNWRVNPMVRSSVSGSDANISLSESSTS